MIDGLAQKNKYADPKSWQKYQESIIEPKIRSENVNGGLGYSANQEFAMFRKTIMFLLDTIAKEHTELMYNEKYLKFVAYFDEIEKIVSDFELNS
jgi:hypothetical protein